MVCATQQTQLLQRLGLTHFMVASDFAVNAFLALPWRVDRSCKKAPGCTESNDAMAHLGDAAFRACVTSCLMSVYQRRLNGYHMGCVRAMIENRQQQSKFAVRLGLDQYVLLSPLREQQGGRSNIDVLERCFEALVGSMWLAFGPAATEQWVHQLVISDTELYASVLQEVGRLRAAPVTSADTSPEAPDTTDSVAQPIQDPSTTAPPKKKKKKTKK
jgi:dsRNA-specific ribonuclease